jgi:hypothetical protein
MPWDTLGGQFQPPPLLMMLNRLYVMTMTMNRQMSTPPTYFLTIQTLNKCERNYSSGPCHVLCTIRSANKQIALLDVVLA